MKSEENTFYLKSKKNNYSAVLVIDNGIFTLKSGSTVSANVSMHFKSYKTVIKRRNEAGIDENNLVLKKDIVFKSSSVAGEFVCGSSCNGPSSWKTEKGITLKMWMEEIT